MDASPEFRPREDCRPMATSPPPLPPDEEDVTIHEEYWREHHMSRTANRVVYPAALLYVAVCWLLLFGEAASPEVVGAVCMDACGEARFLGVSLEWYGAALMALFVAVRIAAQVTFRQSLVAAAISLAFLHGGASLVLAASQWLGFSDFCPLCQVAAALSLLIVVFHVPPASRAFRFPVLAAGQSLLIGGLAVVAAWPHFHDLTAGVLELDEGEGIVAGGAAMSPPEAAPEPDPAGEEVVMAPPGEAPPPEHTLGQAVDFMSHGEVDAPWRLYILSQIGCPICRRFDELTLPVLLEEAVESGHLRITHYYVAQGADARSQNLQLVAASALAAAGASPVEAHRLIEPRRSRLGSVTAAIGLHPDEEVKGHAEALMRDVEAQVGWNAVVREHHRRTLLLRRAFLDGNTGSPSTVLMRNGPDFDRLPPAGEVYAFVGYQLPDPYLEFMGLEVPESEDQ